ncbi:MAG: hypothetical protein LIO93_04380, partial [Bacteroidales bacterium]|nr:hypothetical protein [Bacteroidales bacterium]
LVAVLGVATANAQFESGVKRIKAQTSAFDLEFSGDDVQLNIGLEGSYFIVNNVALKAGLGFEWRNVEDQDSYSDFNLQVGADYYFYRMLYGGIALDFQKIKGTSFKTSLDIEVGATYYIVENMFINPAIYFKSGFGTSSNARFGLELGFGFNF